MWRFSPKFWECDAPEIDQTTIGGMEGTGGDCFENPITGAPLLGGAAGGGGGAVCRLASWEPRQGRGVGKGLERPHPARTFSSQPSKLLPMLLSFYDAGCGKNVRLWTAKPVGNNARTRRHAMLLKLQHPTQPLLLGQRVSSRVLGAHHPSCLLKMPPRASCLPISVGLCCPLWPESSH